MRRSVEKEIWRFGWQSILLLLFLFSERETRAGGSGLNVIVIVNQNSSDSINLGSYYASRRNVPLDHILRVDWHGNAIQWSNAEFENLVLQPLAGLITQRHLANQIDYVVFSMDLPYRVESNSGNSTTSTLYYGFQLQAPSTNTSACTITVGSNNLYAGQEMAFHDLASANSSYRFLATMLTGRTYADAQRLVDQGVAADGTQPVEPVVLVKSHDRSRNIRYKEFDNAIFNSMILGRPTVQRVEADSIPLLSHLFGFEMGDTQYTMPPDAFVPGALADNLTSAGGTLFEDLGQTTLLEFISGGASGSYGTVIEPCNFPQKFPDPQVYFYQGRGFNLAESYYQSITNPYQGIIVGDPLSAPFGRPASGKWIGLPTNALLSGTMDLTVQFEAADPDLPLDRVDLFVDGIWQRTVDNILPSAGDKIGVNIDGSSVAYTVPAGATRSSIARDLAALLSNANPQVKAFARGDRIELHLTDLTRDGNGVLVAASNTSSTAWASPSQKGFINSPADGKRLFRATGKAQPGDELHFQLTKTSGSVTSFGVTNVGGSLNTAQMVQTIFDAINNNGDLAGLDGVIAEDFRSTRTNQSGEFTVRARRAGGVASQIAVTFIGSSSFTNLPVIGVHLDDNRNDLEPRNHLYIRTGTQHLSVKFPLDSTPFSDGYHTLEAVAYEGTAVQTQAHARLGIQVLNSGLGSNRDPALVLALSLTPEVKLSWPAVFGRKYDVLMSNILGQEMIVRTTVSPGTTGLFEWIDPDSGGNNSQRFYRVRVSP